ncbi:hypothetical protein EUX98_g8368 [Antrodiella citrinella]|uniref:Uncharacterized protein n=1 Tax=Antrodiella citrinella TaxID=2447956 RepID=A0A4S4MAE8_9APHY|nr:hypothetical protein EUX98_g8368 [Antrodiella citrinella]
MSNLSQLVPFVRAAQEVARYPNDLVNIEGNATVTAFGGAAEWFTGNLFRAGIPRNAVIQTENNVYQGKLSDHFADALWFALNLLRSQVKVDGSIKQRCIELGVPSPPAVFDEDSPISPGVNYLRIPFYTTNDAVRAALMCQHAGREGAAWLDAITIHFRELAILPPTPRNNRLIEFYCAICWHEEPDYSNTNRGIVPFAGGPIPADDPYQPEQPNLYLPAVDNALLALFGGGGMTRGRIEGTRSEDFVMSEPVDITE